MDTQGIYGVPLHVSATVVFLFVMFGTMLDRAGAVLSSHVWRFPVSASIAAVQLKQPL